ncbi:unnamed protein product [Camellia sinensis]
MNVVFQCVARVMSMREEKTPNCALSARPDTSVSKSLRLKRLRRNSQVDMYNGVLTSLSFGCYLLVKTHKDIFGVEL